MTQPSFTLSLLFLSSRQKWQCTDTCVEEGKENEVELPIQPTVQALKCSQSIKVRRQLLVFTGSKSISVQS